MCAPWLRADTQVRPYKNNRLIATWYYEPETAATGRPIKTFQFGMGL
jgi:hypothetical protein